MKRAREASKSVRHDSPLCSLIYSRDSSKFGATVPTETPSASVTTIDCLLIANPPHNQTYDCISFPNTSLSKRFKLGNRRQSEPIGRETDNTDQRSSGRKCIRVKKTLKSTKDEWRYVNYTSKCLFGSHDIQVMAQTPDANLSRVLTVLDEN